MGEPQILGAHASCEQSQGLQLRNCVATKRDLKVERNSATETKGKRLRQTNKGPFTAPEVVLLRRGSIKTESDIVNGFAMGKYGWPNSIKMPSVSNKATLQSILPNQIQYAIELWMQGRLAAGETHIGNTHHLTAFAKNLLQQIKRQKTSAGVIERLFIAETIAAVRITDIRQLNSEPSSPIIPLPDCVWFFHLFAIGARHYTCR